MRSVRSVKMTKKRQTKRGCFLLLQLFYCHCVSSSWSSTNVWVCLSTRMITIISRSSQFVVDFFPCGFFFPLFSCISLRNARKHKLEDEIKAYIKKRRKTATQRMLPSSLDFPFSFFHFQKIILFLSGCKTRTIIK